MRDVLEVHDRWTKQGKSVAVATVVGVKGSAPRGVGAKMVISSEGEMEGSVEPPWSSHMALQMTMLSRSV